MHEECKQGNGFVLFFFFFLLLIEGPQRLLVAIPNKRQTGSDTNQANQDIGHSTSMKLLRSKTRGNLALTIMHCLFANNLLFHRRTVTQIYV